jgi:hypothetical protein
MCLGCGAGCLRACTPKPALGGKRRARLLADALVSEGLQGVVCIAYSSNSFVGRQFVLL